MTEQLLDDTQVGSTVEQVRRERVPERVRGDTQRQAGPRAQAIEPVAQPAHAQRAAEVIQEDLGGRRCDATALDQDRPAVLEVAGEGLARRTPQQPDPLLPSLAEHTDLATPEVKRAKGRGRELADAQAGGVGGLHEGAVAQREGQPERSAIGVVAGSRVEIRLHDLQQTPDLLDLKHAREPTRQTRRGDRAPRVAWGEAAAGRPAVEGADGGETLCDRGPGVPIAEDPEVRAEVRTRRATPVGAASGQPVKVRPDGRGVGPLGVRRTVACGE